LRKGAVYFDVRADEFMGIPINIFRLVDGLLKLSLDKRRSHKLRSLQLRSLVAKAVTNKKAKRRSIAGPISASQEVRS
jgi:hypothetical protein